MDIPYQQLFDNMPCYLSVQDKDLKVIMANDKFQKDFGNFKGRYCYQVYKSSPYKCEYCAVEKTFEDGLPRTSEEKVKCQDGRDVSVLINTTPIYDNKGDICAVMEMSTDVTGIKNLQRQFKEN